MLIGVYQYAGDVTRSVAGAQLITTVRADQWPRDEADFAEEHGGDFIHEVPEDDE